MRSVESFGSAEPSRSWFDQNSFAPIEQTVLLLRIRGQPDIGITRRRKVNSSESAQMNDTHPLEIRVDERARQTYRTLRETGLSDTDIMAFAGELLSLVASDVRSQSAAAE